MMQPTAPATREVSTTATRPMAGADDSSDACGCDAVDVMNPHDPFWGGADMLASGGLAAVNRSPTATNSRRHDERSVNAIVQLRGQNRKGGRLPAPAPS